MDMALNNLQRLICHTTQQTKPNQTKEIARYQITLLTNQRKTLFIKPKENKGKQIY